MELLSLLDNDFMHYESQVYPFAVGEYPTLRDAFTAGWLARQTRLEVAEGIEPLETFAE